MAAITGRTVPEVGTTTYRPPFTRCRWQAFIGARVGELLAPVRRLPLENVHRASGAVFQEYGGWLRPAHYGGSVDADSAIQDEARRARQSVALFDGSTLGKIEVIGPKAAEFVDFIYYNTMSTLKPGRCRYGFMLSENGVVFRRRRAGAAGRASLRRVVLVLACRFRACAGWRNGARTVSGGARYTSTTPPRTWRR